LQTFGGRAQLVAPSDRRPQGPMAWRAERAAVRLGGGALILAGVTLVRLDER